MTRSEAAKECWKRPEYRERIREAQSDPEYRARLSARVKKEWTDPGIRERHIAGSKAAVAADPQYLAKLSARVKAQWANPDVRARMMNKIKAAANDPKYRARLQKAWALLKEEWSRALAAKMLETGGGPWESEMMKEAWFEELRALRAEGMLRAFEEK